MDLVHHLNSHGHEDTCHRTHAHRASTKSACQDEPKITNYTAPHVQIAPKKDTSRRMEKHILDNWGSVLVWSDLCKSDDLGSGLRQRWLRKHNLRNSFAQHAGRFFAWAHILWLLNHSPNLVDCHFPCLHPPDSWNENGNKNLHCCKSSNADHYVSTPFLVLQFLHIAFFMVSNNRRITLSRRCHNSNVVTPRSIVLLLNIVAIDEVTPVSNWEQ